jgi:hypothetical protein
MKFQRLIIKELYGQWKNDYNSNQLEAAMVSESTNNMVIEQMGLGAIASLTTS